MKIDYGKYLGEFHDLYRRRPIDNNDGGMKSPHLFATYCLLKTLKPTFIIESGVWKGQGTWLMRQALPNSHMASFDVDFSNLSYRDEKTKYIQSDIKNVNWESFFEEHPSFSPDTSLLFLDDHQNFIERLVLLKNSPFKHVMFEDNYPPNHGDCVSPKKIKAGGDYIIDANGTKSYHTIQPEEKMLFESAVQDYLEFPPIFSKEKTRWGDSWKDYETPPSLCDENEPKYPLFQTDSEIDSYTWICYLKLK